MVTIDEIDKLIDSDNAKKVYDVLGCVNSKHKADELKCKNCKQLK